MHKFKQYIADLKTFISIMSKKFYDIIISKKKDKNYKNYNCCSKNTTGPFSARVAKLDSNYLFKLNAFTSSFILFLFFFFVWVRHQGPGQWVDDQTKDT